MILLPCFCHLRLPKHLDRKTFTSYELTEIYFLNVLYSPVTFSSIQKLGIDSDFIFTYQVLKHIHINGISVKQTSERNIASWKSIATKKITYPEYAFDNFIFYFHLVNFPSFQSNIPSDPSYSVHISQHNFYKMSHISWWLWYRHKPLVNRLLSQGNKANWLRNFFWTYTVKVLSIFIIYRICHLECHFNIIVAICEGCHAWGRQRLLNP